MSDVTTAAPAALPDIVYPPPISVRLAWPWALFGAALVLLIYFVGVDEGMASLVPGNIVHEFVHDGRHLLGFPCH